jgi:methionine aminotransferase
VTVAFAQTLASKLPGTGISIFSVMTRLAEEHGAINLSQGFPDFDCAPELVEAVARHMREGHNQYAPMTGVPALRQALARKIERLYGRRYDPATEITITSGATEALYATLTALVSAGDEVVVLQPAYDSYVPAIRLNGGVPRFVTLRGPAYRVDWDEVERVISARTRVMLVNSPHNPTGTVLTAADMHELERVLQGTDAVVVSDEVYEHIVFDGARHESVARHPGLADRAVVISSFGKTFHTTGWKVGYCAAPAALMSEIVKVHQFVTYAVNGAIQRAYAAFVDADPECRDLAAFYERKRDRFLDLIRGSRFTPLACRGTYFQMLDYSAITTEPDEVFAQRLVSRHGVAAIPITPFLHDAEPGPVLRFCFAKRDETLARAAERLCAV